LRYVWLAASFALLASCGLLPEASFELSPEARLPKWFLLPAGVSRTDVSVTMDYYVGPFSRSATFLLKTRNGYRLGKVSASLNGLAPQHINGGSPGSGGFYPAYEVVTVKGIVDVVEHRAMEPIFYMTDDTAVWKAITLPVAR
jgi:hypothetical protein